MPERTTERVPHCPEVVHALIERVMDQMPDTPALRESRDRIAQSARAQVPMFGMHAEHEWARTPFLKRAWSFRRREEWIASRTSELRSLGRTASRDDVAHTPTMAVLCELERQWKGTVAGDT